jgi:ribosomal subunit interface protein
MSKAMIAKNKIRFLLKGVKIDERTKKYVEKKLEYADKLLKNILLKEVEIDLDKKGNFRVEVMIKTPFCLYRSEEITESIEGSIDIVSDELKIQIKKDLERVKTQKKRGRISIKKRMVVDKDARF